MVHALQESLRVLRPGGYLVDIRPAHGDMRLHIISEEDVSVAGPIDTSEWIIVDEASANAFQSLLEEQTLTLQGQTHFKFADYWESLDNFFDYVEENWDSTDLPEYTRQRAREIVNNIDGLYKVRTIKKMLISRYRK